MNRQEELQHILAEVKAWKWTPELFDRCREALKHADVFNMLRRELTPEEYQQFDLEYCEYIRPGQKELVKWVVEERRKEDCKSKEVELLTRKRQLLRQRLRTLTGV